MTINNPTPNEQQNNEPDSEPKETRAERSTRLEAEADALMNKPQEEKDPLAPEPLETLTQEDAATEEGLNTEQSKAIIIAFQNELEAAKEQTVRALAEAENTRRRAKKDKEDTAKFTISGFAKDLLDVSDNLRRALESVPTDLLENEPRLQNFVSGIEATERTLLKGFEKHGILKIEPLDEPFNPNFHEVMFEAPAPGKPAGLIMQVLEPGYILHERLLRPARVGVTKDDGSTPDIGTISPGGHIDTEA